MQFHSIPEYLNIRKNKNKRKLRVRFPTTFYNLQPFTRFTLLLWTINCFNELPREPLRKR